MTKRVVRDAGVPTADFAVIEARSRHRQDRAAFPAVPQAGGGRLRQGRGRPFARSMTAGSLDSVARDLLARFRQPVLVEEFLPGREFTVGITGTGDGRRGAGHDRDRAAGEIMSAMAMALRTRQIWEDKLEQSCAVDDAGRRRRRARWRWRPGGCCAAAMAGAPMCGWTKTASPASSRSIPWPASGPAIPISASSPNFEGLSYQRPDREIPGLVPGAPSGPRHENPGAAFRHRRRCAARGTGHADRRRGGGRGADGAGHARGQAPSAQETLPACWSWTAPEIWCSIWWKAWTARARWRRMAPRHAGRDGHALHRRQRRGAWTLTNDKPLTKAKLRDAGLATPDWSDAARLGRPGWTALDRQSGAGRRLARPGRWLRGGRGRE